MPNKREKIILQLKGFDAAHYRRTEAYARQIDKLCSLAAADYASLAGTLFQPDQNKPFSFDDYPRARKEAQQIINGLAKKIEGVVVRGTEAEWRAACDKNDAFIRSIVRTSKLTPEETAQFQARNLEALQGFQKRKVEGLDLSQRVWKYVGDIKDTMELGIDVALGEGRSAQQLSRDLRECLQEPNKLFRRVRDKYGNLQLSKAARLYHPGQGVYRSSAKNAMRLARTEVNMAYRESEFLRWQQLDFVVGFRVMLSNNHTVLDSKGKPQPLVDICDELAGDYPKTFRFEGWHPQCRCVVVPILSDYDEYNKGRANRLKAIVKGESYKAMPSRRTVTAMPENFTKYVESIADRAKGWKSQPYYIKHNFQGGRIDGGLLPGVATRMNGATKAATQKKPEPCTEYDLEIGNLKKWAYAFGLDVSKLDALRLAGDKAGLRSAIDSLQRLSEKRQEEWLMVHAELSQERNKAHKLGFKDIADEYTLILGENRCEARKYYGDCISNLKAAIQQIKTKIQNAIAAAQKAAQASGDKPHKALIQNYTTDAQVNTTFKDINAGLKEKWFENGDLNLVVETNPNNNGSTSMNGKIWLQQVRIDRVKSALGKIAQGKSATITSDEADAMATFWHEITHNRHKDYSTAYAGGKGSVTRRYMELANEYVARKTLSEFYSVLGCKKTPQPQFIDNRSSTGYNKMVCNYDSVVKKLGLDESKVLDTVRKHLFTEDYLKQEQGLKDGLTAGGIKKADGTIPKPSELTELLRVCRVHDAAYLDNWLKTHGFTK